MLVVDSVIPDGPSDGLLEPGDVLVRIQGQVIVHFLPMEALLDDYVGQRVTVQIERGGELLQKSIMVGASAWLPFEPCMSCPDCEAALLRSLAASLHVARNCWLMLMLMMMMWPFRCKTCMRCRRGPSWRSLEVSCMV
jgi:hypothetical protein